jgi:uncharacterized protein (TIGR01777 family)
MIGKIVIAGGNGFLGLVLTRYFESRAREIVLLSRQPVNVAGNIKSIYWDGFSIGDWASSLERADLLINLAGRSVDCRYTEKNKKRILESRVESTRALGEAVTGCKIPPKVWMNSSSATAYISSYDKPMTERDEIGNDFSMNVCKQWEAEFNRYSLPQTRKIILRTGIVLGRDGGALKPLRNLVKLGLGGRHGRGDQFCSIIHEKDFCRIIEFLLNSRHAEGIFNVTAPNAITNVDFMQALRSAMGYNYGINCPEWLLSVGAVFIRTQTELILKSRKVFPEKLLDDGFVFEFTDAKVALEDLCRNAVRIS